MQYITGLLSIGFKLPIQLKKQNHSARNIELSGNWHCQVIGRPTLTCNSASMIISSANDRWGSKVLVTKTIVCTCRQTWKAGRQPRCQTLLLSCMRCNIVSNMQWGALLTTISEILSKIFSFLVFAPWFQNVVGWETQMKKDNTIEVPLTNLHPWWYHQRLECLSQHIIIIFGK